MATGLVKLYHADRNFGFLTDEAGLDVYVHGDQVVEGPLKAGDLVEFEVSEAESGQKHAVGVAKTKDAPADHPVGRTMANPPSWDELEERDRARRASRRRRR